MPNQKMNQFLKNRRLKNKKIQSYRKQRIRHNYVKMQNHLQQQTKLANVQGQQDEGQKRKIEFYKQVFNGKQDKRVVQERRQVKAEVVVDNGQQKLQKLKDKKKKFIKKMQNQKTKKGQPVMKNFIKYALTKIQQTIQLQKRSKKN